MVGNAAYPVVAKPTTSGNSHLHSLHMTCQTLTPLTTKWKSEWFCSGSKFSSLFVQCDRGNGGARGRGRNRSGHTGRRRLQQQEGALLFPCERADPKSSYRPASKKL